MSGLKEKALSVALVAALLFCTFPISTGVPVLDRGRYQEAEAIAPAVAVIAIFGTALAACGVLAAGTTATQYNANLDSVYNGLKNGTGYWSSSWSQYCQDKGGFDAAMQSALTVDGQNIDLQVLTDAGFFDSLKSYTAYCVGQGTAAYGDISTASDRQVLVIGSNTYYYGNVDDTLVAFSRDYMQKNKSGYGSLIAFNVNRINSNVNRYNLIYAKDDNVSIDRSYDSRLSVSKVYVHGVNFSINKDCVTQWCNEASNRVIDYTSEYLISGIEGYFSDSLQATPASETLSSLA